MKKFLALFLAVLMLTALLPFAVWAEEDGPAAEEESPAAAVTEPEEEPEAPAEEPAPEEEPEAPAEEPAPEEEPGAPAEEPAPEEEPGAPAEEPEPEEEPEAPAEEPEAPAEEPVPEEEPEQTEETDEAEEEIPEDMDLLADPTSGPCGDAVNWELTSGSLIISGTGAMSDWNNHNAQPWAASRESIVTVIIENGVTTVGANAFWGCSGLTSVSFPDTLTEIHKESFQNCGKLTSVRFPASLTKLTGEVFKGSGLTSITFRGSAPEIDANCFKNVKATAHYLMGDASWTTEKLQNYGGKLTWEAIPNGTCGADMTWEIEDGVLRISGTGAMTDYTNATPGWRYYNNQFDEVIVGRGVTSIGGGAFRYYDKLVSVSLPSTLEKIGEEAFFNCTGLTSVDLPASLNKLDERAFYGCTGLRSVTLPGSLSAVGMYAFSECTGLMSVTLLNGIRSIKQYAFSDCPALTSVELPASLTSLEDGAFSNTGLTGINIPASVTDVGGYVFADCRSLVSVTLPAATENIGTGLFRSCTALTSVILPAAPERIFPEAFYGCTALRSVRIPGSVTSIAERAFYRCVSLSSLTLPDSVQQIGNEAFLGCTGISSVRFPSGTERIGKNAFSDCTALRRIVFSGNAPTVGNGVFDGVTAEVFCAAYDTWTDEKKTTCGGTLTWLPLGKCGDTVTWSLSDGTLTLYGSGALSDFEAGASPWYDIKDSIVSVVIDGGITRIGNNAFLDCDALMTVFYRGSDWSEVLIGEGNGPLTAAVLRRYVPAESVAILSGATPVTGSVLEIDREEEKSLRLTARVLPESDLPVIWSSTDPEVAAVDGTGLVTFLGSGIAVINLSTDDGNGAAVTFTVFEGSRAIALDHEYVLLNGSETVQLTAAVTPAAYSDAVAWSAEADEGLTLTCVGGHVETQGFGKGFVTASVTIGGRTYSAHCRVDVAAPEKPVRTQISAVQAITTSVPVEVYRTAHYATVTVLPVLDQNATVLAAGAEKDAGVAITAAQFDSGDAKKYFSLRVKDDRTLEIIPTEKAVADASTSALLSSYSSRIIVTVNGKDFTTGYVKLLVKKVKPPVKAAKLAFNSYLPGEAFALSFTGGTVTGLAFDEAAAKKARTVACPAFMNVELSDGTAALFTEEIPAKYPSKGNLYLLVSVDGWAVPASVKVPFTIKKTLPKLTFSEKSPSLLQGTPDTVRVNIRVTPAVFANTAAFPITVEELYVLTGKTYTKTENNKDLFCDVTDGVLSLRAPHAAEDGKAHTYKLTLSCAGQTFNYTVKTRAANTDPQISLKSGGQINSMVENSPATLTVTAKNFHTGSGESYRVKRIMQYKGLKCENEDVSGLFRWALNGNVFTFTEKEFGTLPAGYTYKAEIGVDLDGDGEDDAAQTAVLKTSFPKTVPAISVSVKKTGALDLARPESSVTLTANVKNWFGDVTFSLVYYKKTGKKTEEVSAEETPFAVEQQGNVFTLKVRPDWKETTSAFSVAVKASANGVEPMSAKTALAVKKGKVTVKSSLASAVFYKKDRFSRAYFTLSIPDPTVATISDVTLDTASAKKFRLLSYGNGVYAIEFLDNRFPASFTASTVKLSVFVQGCTPAVATAKIKITYK